MRKKILGLFASPRKGGNSDLLCDQFIKGAQAIGHETDKIALREQRIHYCSGCGTCYNGAKPCPQSDDMPGILDAIIKADVIVMATPVYFYTMNGQMKTLIDRTCSRYTEIINKEFYYIMTAADNDREAMVRTLEEFRGFISCLDGAVEKGIIYGTGAWKPGDIIGHPAMEEAYRMGYSIE